MDSKVISDSAFSEELYEQPVAMDAEFGRCTEDVVGSFGSSESARAGTKSTDCVGSQTGSVMYFHEDDGPGPVHSTIIAPSTEQLAVPTNAQPATVARSSLGGVRLPPGRPPGRSRPAGPAAISGSGTARPMRKSKMAAADHILALTLQQHGSRRDFGVGMRGNFRGIFCVDEISEAPLQP